VCASCTLAARLLSCRRRMGALTLNSAQVNGEAAKARTHKLPGGTHRTKDPSRQTCQSHMLLPRRPRAGRDHGVLVPARKFGGTATPAEGAEAGCTWGGGAPAPRRCECLMVRIHNIINPTVHTYCYIPHGPYS